MSKVFTSQVLGQLRQHADFDDWYESEQPLAVPFLEGESLPVTLTGVPADPAEAATYLAAADAALRRLLELGAAARHEATPLVAANYQQMLDISDIEPLDVAEPADIWRFVQPTALFVSQDSVQRGSEWQAGDMYVEISCECDWEQEHGLQLVFREGRMLTRVSEQDGHLTEGHAYDRSDEQDTLMMKYYATYGRPTNA